MLSLDQSQPFEEVPTHESFMILLGPRPGPWSMIQELHQLLPPLIGVGNANWSGISFKTRVLQSMFIGN